MCTTCDNSPRTIPLPADCETTVLGIAFFDLSRIAEWASHNEDERVATFLQTFYHLADDTLTPADCTIVKFMGDAGLVVFPKESGESAIFALA